MTGESAWILWTIGGAAIALLLVGIWVWRKGRPFAPGDVFRASRLSDGNRLFPTQVLITPTNVVQFTSQWVGRQEKSIHIAHISSVSIDTGLMFSDVLIETTGGERPIRCHGHYKGDAVAMKGLIERYQNAYYTASSQPPGSPVGTPPPVR
jgi:predicted small integral membrane protein